MTRRPLLVAVLLVGFGSAAALRAQQKCENLAQLKLPHVTITSAQVLPAGSVPGGYGGAPPVDVPPRCVTQGVAPDHLIGTGPAALDPKRQLSRPLCVYPQVAKYKGTGDANDAASFVCAAPR